MTVRFASPLLLLALGLPFAAGAVQARTFISPMGEPFRGDGDGKAPDEVWFAGADKNGDGRITRAEFLTDAGRFFMALDVNHDREIGPEEIDRYEQEVAPEVRSDSFGNGGGLEDGIGGTKHPHRGGGGGHRGGGGGGGGSDGAAIGGDYDHPQYAYDTSRVGASRFSYLDLPEPVIAADTDFNRGVSPKEFADAAYQRFAALDTDHDGALTRDELPKLGGPPRGGKRRPPGKDAPPPPQ